MAEIRTIRIQDAQAAATNVRLALFAGKDTSPLVDLGNGARGTVVARGVRRRNPLDSRSPRDTRIVVGKSGPLDVLMTGRFTGNDTVHVAESNVMVVDSKTGEVSGTNILTIAKEGWESPLVMGTSDPAVVVGSLERLTRRLGAEARQLRSGELVAYDSDEFGRD